MNNTAGQRSYRLNDLEVNPHYRDLLLANGLDTLDALFSTPLGQRLDKPGLPTWRERLRLTLDDNGRTRVIYLKRIHYRRSTATRFTIKAATEDVSLVQSEWAMLAALAARGIACPERVAAGWREDEGVFRGAVVTEAVPGEALERIVPNWGASDWPRVRALIKAVADLVARLHGAGFVHRDLYLSHIFCDLASPPESSLHFIDLARVISPTRWRRRRWVVKDLAALNYSCPAGAVTDADRVRWLRRYLGVSKLRRSDGRLIKSIMRKTGRIARHDRRRLLKDVE